MLGAWLEIMDVNFAVIRNNTDRYLHVVSIGLDRCPFPDTLIQIDQFSLP